MIAARYVRPPIAPSQPYGEPSWPRASSTTKAMMIALSTASPARAVAWVSIWRERSSRPSPRSPRIVSLRPPKSSRPPKAAMMASDQSPLRGLPPIHWATSSTTPSPSANSGVNHLDLVIRIEGLLDAGPEVAREGERQGERGGGPLGLDRADGLARDVHRLGQLALREAPCDAKLAHAVP